MICIGYRRVKTANGDDEVVIDSCGASQSLIEGYVEWCERGVRSKISGAISMRPSLSSSNNSSCSSSTSGNSSGKGEGIKLASELDSGTTFVQKFTFKIDPNSVVLGPSERLEWLNGLSFNGTLIEDKLQGSFTMTHSTVVAAPLETGDFRFDRSSSVSDPVTFSKDQRTVMAKSGDSDRSIVTVELGLPLKKIPPYSVLPFILGATVHDQSTFTVPSAKSDREHVAPSARQDVTVSGTVSGVDSMLPVCDATSENTTSTSIDSSSSSSSSSSSTSSSIDPSTKGTADTTTTTTASALTSSSISSSINPVDVNKAHIKDYANQLRVGDDLSHMKSWVEQSLLDSIQKLAGGHSSESESASHSSESRSEVKEESKLEFAEPLIESKEDSEGVVSPQQAQAGSSTGTLNNMSSTQTKSPSPVGAADSRQPDTGDGEVKTSADSADSADSKPQNVLATVHEQRDEEPPVTLDLRTALVEYYKIHDVSKIEKIGLNMERFSNREAEMIELLEAKYRTPFPPCRLPTGRILVSSLTSLKKFAGWTVADMKSLAASAGSSAGSSAGGLTKDSASVSVQSGPGSSSLKTYGLCATDGYMWVDIAVNSRSGTPENLIIGVCTNELIARFSGSSSSFSRR